MARVLIVDDAPEMRDLLVYLLGSDPEIEIMGCATDGEDAVRMTRKNNPDVIVMDIHMPKMDGCEATRKIMQTCPTPIVIIVPGQGQDVAEAGMRAIQAGALVAVPRPIASGGRAQHAVSDALIRTVKSMAQVKVVRRWPALPRQVRDGEATAAADGRQPAPRLVLLGASTGGPAILRDILAELPPDYPLPVIIVQHMTAGFAAGFSQWLSTASGFPVRIAEDGAQLAGGSAYLAPDGYQLGVSRDLRIALAPLPAEHGMRPSVSYLFRSIPRNLRGATAAVLLTGMGKDGALELKCLKDEGALTIVQDRATSAVYGMPGEALKLGAARLVLEPKGIGKTLRAYGNHASQGFFVCPNLKERQ